MLEFGAGTGLVSEALQHTVGPIALADASAGMRQVLADKIDAGRLRSARVWDHDLVAAPSPERFDLVVTVMALHHVSEIEAVLTGFASALHDGGALAVVDLEAEDGTFHPEDFDGHHGFDRSDLTRRLEQAGFDRVEFRPAGTMSRPSGDYPLFLATAVRRAPTSSPGTS